MTSRPLPFKPRTLYLEEPLLEFRHGQRLVYPRDGLFLYGPVGETKQLPAIRYGVIGTPDGVQRFRAWAMTMAGFIDIPPPGPRSRAVEPQHVPFPGFAEAFHADWPIDPPCLIDDLDDAEIERTLRIANRHEAIRSTVDLFLSRLVAENNRLESAPQFWFVVIPERVYDLGRPQSTVRRDDRVAGTVTITQRRARQLQTQPTLFGDDEREAEVYQYATHFRRQLKARLLKERIVTQIVRETTLAPGDFRRESGMPVRRVEDPATIAWKLGTGAYYKAGGKPWQLADVRPGVCYVGLVYKRSELMSDKRHACCAAQMFLSDGEGVVFRGALGPWFQTDTKQFHLDHDAARNLIQMVVGEYSRLHDGPPSELFIHAKSAFTDDEWRGFAAGCDDETNLVGVQIADARDDLKLYRPGEYPVIRGTALQIGERHALLWTSGYVPRLDTYMGPETPNPISVRVLRGECALKTVLSDVLGLTKINFNSCLHNDRLPVTIRFANAVGDVLISAPIDSEPKLPFKFYI
ncbi:hypothetical protein DLJ53_08300 [Acuticoccus sediminis]|uniref:Piwi domain-containing protein n=1 Tax=Acuticoccus sediminis TaxID=2184697 RepID=A0A8B2NT34_9HYPH|nr:hypothetical protein [Acuticoccus sediminis]RAI01428.1 hypothetical protein DLJ53_08300 [Acuticoccus sediminis]